MGPRRRPAAPRSPRSTDPDPEPGPTAVGATRPLLLVCTHGIHDTCCALRGRPVAAALAEHWPDAVWECSHVGGDRFAPNVVVLPDGYYYGQLDPESAVAAVRSHLAGTVDAALAAGDGALRPARPGRGRGRVRALRSAGPRRRHRVGTSGARVPTADTARPRSSSWRSVAGPSVNRRTCWPYAARAQLTCRAARETPATEYQVTWVRRRPHRVTRRIRSSFLPGVTRPSVLLVVIHSAPSGATTTLRTRP